MIWPWSRIHQLELSLARERERNAELLFRCELRETIALKAMRDVSAAHKGIRRLVEKLKKLRMKGTGDE